jgi:CDP-2,3-bis-(O-geranylgeranyl)-sn-glycerol synthase
MASLRWGYLYPGFVRSATPVALEAIPQALWFFLPAFIANPMAVVFGGGSPIDGGRSLSDGQRMFGDGKTWRGLIGGAFSGAILGLLLSLPFALLASSSSWSYGSPAVAFVSSAALALGALLGDLVGAFVKRRMHLPRGAKASGLDQYDFVVGALVLSLLVPSWSVPRFFSGDALLGLLAIIVITPALHRAVNLVGYRMGKKHEPW